MSKYYWKRVQEHQIILGIQFHGIRTCFGTHMAGEYKKSVKKDQNAAFQQLFFWGGFTEDSL